jgi:hypothetical protein
MTVRKNILLNFVIGLFIALGFTEWTMYGSYIYYKKIHLKCSNVYFVNYVINSNGSQSEILQSNISV